MTGLMETKMTKEQIQKENKRLQSKVKRLQKELELCKQMLEMALEDASRLEFIVAKHKEYAMSRDARKQNSSKMCAHCNQRKATCSDHNNKPVCKHCFGNIARGFAHGW